MAWIEDLSTIIAGAVTLGMGGYAYLQRDTRKRKENKDGDNLMSLYGKEAEKAKESASKAYDERDELFERAIKAEAEVMILKSDLVRANARIAELGGQPIELPEPSVSSLKKKRKVEE